MNYSIIISFVVFLLAVDLTFSLQCYECFEDHINFENKPDPETTDTQVRDCFFNESQAYSGIKINCQPNEQCVKTSSDLYLRRYHGCVKDTEHFCNKYQFDNCTFCDKDLCNEFDSIHLNRCYRCYSGAYDKKFNDTPSCTEYTSKPTRTCGYGKQCATAFDKYGQGRFYDCGPLSNNSDEFCKNYGLDVCELCNGFICNNKEKTKKKCYDCRVGDITPILAEHSVDSANCSQPTITTCSNYSDSCLSLTVNSNGKLIGALHTCTAPNYFEKVCKEKEIDCRYCEGSLCNEVKNYTAISPHKKKCYDCRFGDLSPLMTNYSINSTNCSQPTIKVCAPSDRCLSLTVKRNATTIGAFHTCIWPYYLEEDCKRDGIDCQYCDDDLCNKIENDTVNTPPSSAEALKDNSVSLLHLLFIFIIIRAAL